MNHSDTRRHSVARASEILPDTVKQDLARISSIEAIEHIHQCGFTRAIFTKESVNLAGFDN
jgi:hypothetical protein